MSLVSCALPSSLFTIANRCLSCAFLWLVNNLFTHKMTPHLVRGRCLIPLMVLCHCLLGVVSLQCYGENIQDVTNVS